MVSWTWYIYEFISTNWNQFYQGAFCFKLRFGFTSIIGPELTCLFEVTRNNYYALLSPWHYSNKTIDIINNLSKYFHATFMSIFLFEYLLVWIVIFIIVTIFQLSNNFRWLTMWKINIILIIQCIAVFILQHNNGF